MMLSVWAFWLLLAPASSDLRNVELTLARGDHGAALKQLLSLTTRDARWHLLASRAYDGMNDPAKAVAEAEEALKLDPQQPVYHVQLAQIFLSRNTPKAALEIFTDAQVLFPEVFAIRLGKGLALKELQLYTEAVRELVWCLERQPSAALPFDALATVYVQQSRFTDARLLAMNFLKHDSSDYRGFYFLASAGDGELRPVEEISGLLKQSLERNPSFAAAHALMGKVLLRADNPREASTYLKRAIELRPDLVQAHLHLARALRDLGDEASALREFEIVRQLKAKEQAPVPSLRYHRGTR